MSGRVHYPRAITGAEDALMAARAKADLGQAIHEAKAVDGINGFVKSIDAIESHVMSNYVRRAWLPVAYAIGIVMGVLIGRAWS